MTALRKLPRHSPTAVQNKSHQSVTSVNKLSSSLRHGRASSAFTVSVCRAAGFSPRGSAQVGAGQAAAKSEYESDICCRADFVIVYRATPFVSPLPAGMAGGPLLHHLRECFRAGRAYRHTRAGCRSCGTGRRPFSRPRPPRRRSAKRPCFPGCAPRHSRADSRNARIGSRPSSRASHRRRWDGFRVLVQPWYLLDTLLRSVCQRRAEPAPASGGGYSYAPMSTAEPLTRGFKSRSLGNL